VADAGDDDANAPPPHGGIVGFDGSSCTRPSADASPGRCPKHAVSSASIDFDGGLACSDRPAAQCGEGGVCSLVEKFQAQVRMCGGLSNESFLQVDFEDGCATDITVDMGGGVQRSVELVNCLAPMFASVRWDCAPELTCFILNPSTLQ
jgi:hypothetical protein